MKIRAVLPDDKDTRQVASNLSAQEFLDEARQRFPIPSPFMQEFLRRFEALAEADAFEPADHIITCPQCGTQMTLEIEE